eukprot:scaffold31794_cov107-Isochrysis_galbana.AAC.3
MRHPICRKPASRRPVVREGAAPAGDPRAGHGGPGGRARQRRMGQRGTVPPRVNERGAMRYAVGMLKKDGSVASLGNVGLTVRGWTESGRPDGRRRRAAIPVADHTGGGWRARAQISPLRAGRRSSVRVRAETGTQPAEREDGT